MRIESYYDGRKVLAETTKPAEYHRFDHIRPDGSE